MKYHQRYLEQQNMSGAEARGLKIEDIEYVLDTNEYDYTSYGKYKQKEYNIAKNGINFPVVWGEMGESQVAENRSKQSEIHTGTNKPITPIQPISNYWTFPGSGQMYEENLVATALYDVIVPSTTTYYWLSSRYAQGESAVGEGWYFGMMRMLGATLSNGQLYRGNNETSEVTSCGVRPVVIIPKTSCNIRPGGNNGESYHIEPKA